MYREGDPRFEIGKAIEHGRGDDLTIVATGSMVHPALGAAAKLNAAGVSAGVLDMHTVKPLDETAVLDAARRSGLLLTVEEHSVLGGLGGAVAETVTGAGVGARVVRHGIADEYALIGPRRTSTATTASTPRASRRRHCERSAGSGDRPLGPGIRDLRPGTAAARRSSVEVDITPPGSGGSPMPNQVIVGIDGSAHAWRALDWAADYAVRHRLSLDLVHASRALVEDGTIPPDALRGWSPNGRTCSPRRCSTLKLHPDLGIGTRLARTDPGSALVEGSGQAAMVAVGSRGLGGFEGLLFGSVGLYTAAHARCPVLVVPREAPYPADAPRGSWSGSRAAR